MKNIAFLAAMTVFFMPSLIAQRELQNKNAVPVNISMQSSTTKSNYIVKGMDSTLLNLISTGPKGLEIVSCTNCEVNGAYITVEIKNKGTVQSNSAMVTVDYYASTIVKTGIPGEGEMSESKTFGPIEPGGSIRVPFTIFYSVKEILNNTKKKTVNVTLREKHMTQPKSPTPLTARVRNFENEDAQLHFVNINVPGLQILSCKKCVIEKSLANLSPQVEVEVKNTGQERSNPAFVCIDYYGAKAGGFGYIGYGDISQKKALRPLDPGETAILVFDIVFGYQDFYAKTVTVSLQQNTRGRLRF